MVTGLVSNVRYMLSGDGSNWFYVAGGLWTNYNPAVDGQGFNVANTVDDINTYIDDFYTQAYDKVGGELQFRMYLGSDGEDQVAVDDVTVGYSEGRITVIEPNGLETNGLAWLIGVTNRIIWEAAENAAGNVKIEYSLNGGAPGSWKSIAASYPNVIGLNHYDWLIPGLGDVDESLKCLVRITHLTDATIRDTSDSQFHILYQFQVLEPIGGEKILLGTTNSIRWAASVGLVQGQIDYAPDGINYTWLMTNNITSAEGSTNNVFRYAFPKGFPELLSETGRVRVRTRPGNRPTRRTGCSARGRRNHESQSQFSAENRW